MKNDRPVVHCDSWKINIIWGSGDENVNKQPEKLILIKMFVDLQPDPDCLWDLYLVSYNLISNNNNGLKLLLIYAGRTKYFYG